MEAFWTEELTPEEEEKLIDKVAHEVTRRGLEVPSVFFLESHKPLSGIIGQSLIVFSPFIAPFVGMSNVHDYSRLVSRKESIEKLINRIEEIGVARKEAENDPVTKSVTAEETDE